MWDSSREVHATCPQLLFYTGKPPGLVLCFRTFRASSDETDADLHPEDAKSLITGTEQAKREDCILQVEAEVI